jgi:hypothetical protein
VLAEASLRRAFDEAEAEVNVDAGHAGVATKVSLGSKSKYKVITVKRIRRQSPTCGKSGCLSGRKSSWQ